MINFETENGLILFVYRPGRDTNYWVVNKLEGVGAVTFQRTFNFQKSDLYNANVAFSDIDELEPLKFIFANIEGEYYKIRDHILSLNISVFIHHDVTLSSDYFVAIKNISIFKKIDKIINEDIYIGGEHERAMPIGDFVTLIKHFPNSYELEKYVHSRLGSILLNYFDSSANTEIIYNNYMNKKMPHPQNLWVSIGSGKLPSV